MVSFVAGAFYYHLGNLSPSFRSKIHNIQLLLLAKASTVSEFGIDRMLEPIVDDIRKLESVTCRSKLHTDSTKGYVFLHIHVCARTHTVT